MEDLKKEFVPYEEALALKELGFNEPCFAYYTVIPEDNINWFTIPEQSLSDGKRTFGRNENYNTKFFQKEGTISAPTFSQTFRWFRENYKLSGLIEIGTQEYSFIIFDEAKDSRKISSSMNGTPEEAELACLRNLIEIGAQEWFNRQLDKDKK